MALGAVSVVALIIVTFFVRLIRLIGNNIMGALYFVLIASGVLAAVGFYWVTNTFFDGSSLVLTVFAKEPWFNLVRETGLRAGTVFLTSLIGLVVTLGMVIITEFFTSKRFGSVKAIAKCFTNWSRD